MSCFQLPLHNCGFEGLFPYLFCGKWRGKSSRPIKEMEIQSMGRGCGKGVCRKGVVTRLCPMRAAFKAHPPIFAEDAQDAASDRSPFQWFPTMGKISWAVCQLIWQTIFIWPKAAGDQAENWVIKNWPVSSPPGYDAWEDLNPDKQQVQHRIC